MSKVDIAGSVSGIITLQGPAVAGTKTVTFPAETGTLVTSASSTVPNTIVWNTTVQTSGFTASNNTGYFCNTTSTAFTVTLPASPSVGYKVTIVDYAGTFGTNNLTVSGNSSKINGSSAGQVLSTNRTGVTFTYIDSTQGWLVSSNVYKGGYPFTITASYLIIAGGGGGAGAGGTAGGGGGAGGYIKIGRAHV